MRIDKDLYDQFEEAAEVVDQHEVEELEDENTQLFNNIKNKKKKKHGINNRHRHHRDTTNGGSSDGGRKSSSTSSDPTFAYLRGFCASVKAVLLLMVVLAILGSIGVAFQEIENRFASHTKISSSSSSRGNGDDDDQTTTQRLIHTIKDAIQAARSTGIDIQQQSGGQQQQQQMLLQWMSEPYGGQTKPKGPFHNKHIGILLANGFHDYQVYYLLSYLGELGATTCELLLVVDEDDEDGVDGPTETIPVVQGMYGLTVNDPRKPIMTGRSNKCSIYKKLQTVNTTADQHYDAIIVVGGYQSADIMVTQPHVIGFLQQQQQVAATQNANVVIGSIGEGSLPLIASGLVDGKRVTGNHNVDYMLQKIASEFVQDQGVVIDGTIITAKDTQDLPTFVRSLCKVLAGPSHDYKDWWKDSLMDKTILIPVSGAHQDMELIIVLTMELLYRGAKIVIGTLPSTTTTTTTTTTAATATKPSQSPQTHDYDVVLGGIIPTNFDNKNITDNNNNINTDQEYDMIVLMDGYYDRSPGGDGLDSALFTNWLQEAHAAGKLIAAIDHGPIALAAADLVNNKTLTGWKSAKTAVTIMGGKFYRDNFAAVIDGRIVSGRSLPELPEFIDAISIALLSQQQQEEEGS